MSDYKETLDYLFNQLPMFQRVGATAFKKDLTNTLKLCNHLQNPHDKFRSIHIAGTNGKGSVAHILAAILQSGGYKTGLYTSPHLKDFRERIRINGQPIAEERVISFVNSNKGILEKIKPSFFEMSVTMAFDAFARDRVDIAIIETGMGGRFDSTNVLTPMLSVITTISLDHQQYLGDSEEKIAMEKAGIIKTGIPVVVGSANSKVRQVFIDKGHEKTALLSFANDIFQEGNYRVKGDGMILDILQEGNAVFSTLETDLKGNYQRQNIITALAALNQLHSDFIEIDEQHIRTGLGKVHAITGLQGRWQVIGNHPLIIADCGHNNEAIKLVLQQLKTQPYKELHIVLGMVNDKDAERFLSLFPREAKYYFCRPNIPRGMDEKELQDVACNNGLNGRGYSSVNEAFIAAKGKANNDDLIFIGGSTFVVAEVL